MKVKYYILAAIAVLAFAACEEENGDEQSHGKRLHSTTQSTTFMMVIGNDTTVNHMYDRYATYEWSAENPKQIVCITTSDTTGVTAKDEYKYNEKGQITDHTTLWRMQGDQFTEMTDHVTYLSDRVCVISSEEDFMGNDTIEVNAAGQVIRETWSSPHLDAHRVTNYEWKNGDMVKSMELYTLDGVASSTTTSCTYDKKNNAWKNAGHPFFDSDVQNAHNMLTYSRDNESETCSYTYEGEWPTTCTITATSDYGDEKIITVYHYVFTYENY